MQVVYSLMPFLLVMMLSMLDQTRSAILTVNDADGSGNYVTVGSAGILGRLGVSHVYDSHSPWMKALAARRGRACDEACISRARTERILRNAWERPRRGQKGRRLGTPWAREASFLSKGGRRSEYYVTVSAGTPPSQTVTLLLDTGSGLLWFQCKPCHNCYPQQGPIFDRRRSSTFRFLTVDDSYCQTVQQTNYGTGADDSSCIYEIEYVDGDATQGSIAQDSLTWYDLDTQGSSTITIENVGFGCGTNNTVQGLVASSGILGLENAGLGLSLPEQLNMNGYYSSDFSYCLAPRGSTSDTGFLYLAAGAVPGVYFPTTPFLNHPAWLIEVVEIYVAGSVVGIPDDALEYHPENGRGGTLVDSGSLFCYLFPSVYYPFRDAWRAALSPVLGDPGPGYNGLDTCYDYPSNLDSLPQLAFGFRDGTLFTLHDDGKTFIYSSGRGNRRMCWPYLVTEEEDDTEAFLMGAIPQQTIQMIFDVDNNRLGWLYDQCLYSS